MESGDFMEEEKVVTFFVEYNKMECVIQLLEYVTVGTLKKEINNHFHIPTKDQIIEGWLQIPEDDNTILSFCVDLININSLTVRTISTMESNQFSPTVTNNDEYELEAVNDFLSQVLLNLPNSTIGFHSCRLNDAVNACRSPQKILLLYLHNKYDNFSTIFWRNLQKPHIIELLNKYFFILGWSVEDTKYHSALNTALNKYNLCVVKTLVERKSGAALCLVPTDDTVEIYSCMREKYSDNDFLTALQNAVEFIFGNMEPESRTMTSMQIQQEPESRTMTSMQIQQHFADMFGNRDYNGFEFNQHEYLKKDIAYALRGPPESEKGYSEDINKDAETFYKKILENSNKFSQYHDKVEISFIYNCLEPVECAENSIVNPIPIFIIRKCHNSDHPCRIFVDHTGRVYESWKDYINNNKLPECAMVLPKNGRYDFDKDGHVLLERQLSPACKIGTKVLKGFDIGTSVAGVASTGTIAAAAVLPTVAALPFLVIPAMVTGAAVGVYSIVRSSQTLHDRATHQQTMSPRDAEARGAYLNIAAGSLGFVGAGTNMLVSQLVTQGINIGKGARIAVNTVNILNLSAGGASVINSTVDVVDQWYNKNQTPSALTILQLSSSILFFGHAVVNFKTAGTMIEETQARTLQDYKDSLRSNRHRKTFNKLLKETIRRNDGNAAQGQAEIISTLRNMPSRDEVFAVLTRSNKEMNKQGIKFHAEGGQIKLNGISIDMAEFATMNKKEINIFLSDLPIRADPTPAEMSSMQDMFSSNNLNIPNSKILAAHAVQLLGCFRGDIRNDMIRLLAKVLDSLTAPFINLLDKLFPGVKKFLNMMDMLLGYFIKLTKGFEEWLKAGAKRNDEMGEFYKTMHEYVKLGRSNLENVQNIIEYCCEFLACPEDNLKRILTYFVTWITTKVADYQNDLETSENRERHSAQFTRKQKVICKTCKGHYFN